MKTELKKNQKIFEKAFFKLMNNFGETMENVKNIKPLNM